MVGVSAEVIVCYQRKMNLVFVAISSTILATGLAHGQVTVSPAAQSDASHIRAERAKDADASRNEATKRPWDKDANGKRPWEIPFPRAKTLAPD